MPKQEGQKSKLLALLRIFEQQTDEEHLLNVPQLVELLARQVLDTVDGDTPASAATSRMVTATKTAPLCRRWGKSGACTARFRFCPYCKRGRAQCQSCGRNLRKKFA